MIKYIIGTLIILWYKIINFQPGKAVKRVEPKIPWYRQLIWFYSPPTQISPNLYLGSGFNSYDLDNLKKLNINVIINVTREMKSFYLDNLKLNYYQFAIRDDGIEEIDSILEESYETISAHLASNDTILVHCYMGASRSASVIINYLMRDKRMDYQQAYQMVKAKRPIINLSEKFDQTLKNLDLAI